MTAPRRKSISRAPDRTRSPIAVQYHDDLPDIFEPLPFDPHMHWAIDHMGIETPGELIDDAPVVLHGDGELRRARAGDPADYLTTVLDGDDDDGAWEP